MEHFNYYLFKQTKNEFIGLTTTHEILYYKKGKLIMHTYDSTIKDYHELLKLLNLN